MDTVYIFTERSRKQMVTKHRVPICPQCLKPLLAGQKVRKVWRKHAIYHVECYMVRPRYNTPEFSVLLKETLSKGQYLCVKCKAPVTAKLYRRGLYLVKITCSVCGEAIARNCKIYPKLTSFCDCCGTEKTNETLNFYLRHFGYRVCSQTCVSRMIRKKREQEQKNLILIR